MMTLTEAIEHAESVAVKADAEPEGIGAACAAHHRQLAAWLRELACFRSPTSCGTDQGHDGGQRGPPHDEAEPRLPDDLCRDCKVCGGRGCD